MTPDELEAFRRQLLMEIRQELAIFREQLVTELKEEDLLKKMGERSPSMAISCSDCGAVMNRREPVCQQCGRINNRD